MKDKLTKRVKIDYLALIKGHGLYWCFLRWRKHLSKKIKSKHRQQYLFCMSYLYEDLKKIKYFEADVEFYKKPGVRSLPYDED